MQSLADIQALSAYHTDFHLYDSYKAGVPGGTGETFAWELAAGRGRVAPPRRKGQRVPVILSGGLTPENVADGIAAVKPFAVDVASGVESAPGYKDHDRMRAFAAAVAETAEVEADQPAGADAPPPADAPREARAPREACAPGETEATAEVAARSLSRRSRHRRRHERPLAIEHRFGPYGGQYVPETLMPALTELEEAWVQARVDPEFQARFRDLLHNYVGRPTPLYLAERISAEVGHPVYLKREDLNHTGAHKINNALGQALLAKRMGKTRIIAETGAGQARRVATATACALLDLDCVVYMGTEDIRRQMPNVQRMELLGATVVAVEAGARTLKEAVSAAIRDWVTNVGDTHYILGTGRRPRRPTRRLCATSSG